MVTHCAVDQDAGRFASAHLDRQQLAEQCDGAGLGHGEHHDVARLDPFDGRVDHQVVILAADDGPRRPGRTRTRDHLDQRRVDQAFPAARLVHGRDAQFGQPGQLLLVHRLFTTHGSVRCSASAYLTSPMPEIRRAWLPRREASSV